jgi:hypothetical protein
MERETPYEFMLSQVFGINILEEDLREENMLERINGPEKLERVDITALMNNLRGLLLNNEDFDSYRIWAEDKQFEVQIRGRADNEWQGISRGEDFVKVLVEASSKLGGGLK